MRDINMSLTLTVFYYVLLAVLILIAWQHSKLMKKVKRQVQSLQVVYDIARSNNNALKKQIIISQELNDCSSEQWDEINVLRNRIVSELNIWEDKRHSYESLFKPVNRSRKKKVRGKRK